MQIIRRFSITLSKRVVGDASNSVVRGSSNTQCCKKSVAAAVASDSEAVKKKPRRLPKDERRAMLEAFINKYRATNGGKFPPTKKAMKEVGGSYYTVKKLVEELYYNSKMPVQHKDAVVKEASAGASATRKELTKVEETLSSTTVVERGECEGQLTNVILLEKELSQNRKPLPGVQEILSNQRTVDTDISQEALLFTEGGDTNSIRKAEARQQAPIAVEQSSLQEMSRTSGSDNKDAAAQVVESELETFSHSEEPEYNIKQVSPMEKTMFDDLKQMDEQQHSPELEKRTRDLSNEHKADTQAESKSSMWKNLRSLADGILNMWKKL